MGSGPTTTQNQLQNQFQTQNYSGNYNNTSQLSPYGPTAGILSNAYGMLGSVNPGLNPGQASALTKLYNLGQAGNPFESGITNATNTLLSGGNAGGQSPMVNAAYEAYKKTLDPYAGGQFNDPSTNPALQKYLEVARNDVINTVNPMFAAAGRDLSGLNTQTLARGITAAEAPILYDAYNQSIGRQLQSAGNLYNAGNTTAGILSNFNQQGLSNKAAGIEAANAATSAQQYGPLLELKAASDAYGIPMQQMASLLGLTLPGAQAFGTQTGQGATSGTSTGTTYGTGTTTAQQQTPLANLIAGGLLGGAGLLGSALGPGWLKPSYASSPVGV